MIFILFYLKIKDPEDVSGRKSKICLVQQKLLKSEENLSSLIFLTFSLYKIDDSYIIFIVNVFVINDALKLLLRTLLMQRNDLFWHFLIMINSK